MRLVLVLVDRARLRAEAFFFVVVFFELAFGDALPVAATVPAAAGFFGVEEVSGVCAARGATNNSATAMPAAMRVPMAAKIEDEGDFIVSL